MGEIIRMTIENLRCISLQSIEFSQGKVNLLKGSNGSGKTTAIDALYMALLGKSEATKFRGQDSCNVIKNDTDTASIELEFKTSAHNFKIKRVITREHTGANFAKLVVTSDNKMTARDVVQLFALQSIDIMGFLSKNGIEQLEYLEKLVDPASLASLKEQQAKIEENIHTLYADKRNTDDRVRNAPVKTKPEIEDVSEISQKRDAVHLLKEKNHALLMTQQSAISKEQNAAKEYHNILSEIEEMKKKLDDAKSKHVKAYDEAKKISDEVEAFQKQHGNADKELKDLESKLEKNQKLLVDLSQYNTYADDVGRSEDLLKKINENQTVLKDIASKKTALFNARGIKTVISYEPERGILLDQLPFCDMSQGEKIFEISKILHATFDADQVRLCIIRNANCLDSLSLQQLHRCAKEYNITFICEWVNDDQYDLSVDVVEGNEPETETHHGLF